MPRPFPPELADVRDEIREYALEYGLDFYQTIFEVLTYEEVNMVAAYGGFPTRYPHWKFGMEYEQLSKSYEYGLSKIYEMVINNDPCYAYLLEGNEMVDQKIVIAHVYGHCDFFKNNMMFNHTNRKMMDEMANHGTKIHRYAERFGRDRVETFLDCCLSIDNLIDYNSVFLNRGLKTPKRGGRNEKQAGMEVPLLKVDKEYMRHYINPKEYIDEQRQQMMEEAQKSNEGPHPAEPQLDILLFLIEHAPLRPWEAEILSMLREEAYYFAPQGQTKILNEGWAVYWHSKIMTTRAMHDDEVITFADHHSGTTAMRPGSLNPYKIGLELLRDIEYRWDTGRFGKEWNECDDMAEKVHWKKDTGLGREKIFQVRKLYNDVTLIDEFFTLEFCRDAKLFGFDFNARSGDFEITTRAFNEIKQKILFSLTNFGQPQIAIANANYKNRSELLLAHRHLGIDLQLDYAGEVLKNIYRFWKRPVNIETKLDDKNIILTFDGKELKRGEEEVKSPATDD